jgi:hypothetical protein
MLDKLLQFADARAALAALIFFVSTTLVFGIVDTKPKVMCELGCKYIPIGMTPQWRRDEIGNMLLNDYKQPQVEAERRSLLYDFGYLVIYGLMLTIVLAYVLRVIWPGGFRGDGVVALLPAFAAVFDAVENTTLYVCLGQDRNTVDSLLPFSRAATLVKLTLLGAAFLLFFFGALKLAAACLRR